MAAPLHVVEIEIKPGMDIGVPQFKLNTRRELDDDGEAPLECIYRVYVDYDGVNGGGNPFVRSENLEKTSLIVFIPLRSNLHLYS